MATSVTINGAYQYPGPGNDLVVIYDVTVAGTHHQVKFLKSDLKQQPTLAQMQQYVAKQCLAANTQATGVSTVPTTDIDVRGTLSV